MNGGISIQKVSVTLELIGRLWSIQCDGTQNDKDTIGAGTVLASGRGIPGHDRFAPEHPEIVEMETYCEGMTSGLGRPKV